MLIGWHSMKMVMDTHRVVKRLKEAGFTDHRLKW